MRAVFLAAIWFALLFGTLAGMGQWVLSINQPPVSPLAIRPVSAQILWVEPLFDLVIFLTLAVALVVVKRWIPRLPTGRAAMICFVFLASLGLILPTGWLHRAAALVLAAGLAALADRWLRGRGEAVAAFFRRTLPYAAALWLVTCASGLAWEQRGTSPKRQVSNASGSPNVLLIVLDTVRADRMSLHGYARPTTPFLERMAKEGTMFTQAVAPSSWTLPSHASLFTGLPPNEHGAGRKALASHHRTLAEVFLQRGYRTGGFAANFLFCYGHTGLAQGFQQYRAVMTSPVDAAARTVFGQRILYRVAALAGYRDLIGRQNARDINAMFLRWLDSSGNDLGQQAPFFAFLNYFDAHDPYMPPPEFGAKFSASGDALLRRRPVNPDFAAISELSAESLAQERDAYDAAIAFMDAQLENLFAELARRGLLDSTIVVVTSDHGEAHGEHETLGHGKNLYREALHIPLLVRWPGKVAAGVRDSRIVSLTDVPATLLALAGLSAELPGRILVPRDGRPPDSTGEAPGYSNLDAALWRYVPMRESEIWMHSLVTPQWHFIRKGDGSVELFDWRQDPAELQNLADTEDGKPVVEKFLADLQQLTQKNILAGRNRR
jgi:arylsulfatase A-like enzyme